MSGTLITASELAARLGEPTLRIADCRWYLADHDQGRREYADGHIPRSIDIDLETDLSAASGPGRHPLPDREAFAERLGSMGIGSHHTIVAYDDRSGAVAARLWWMLRDIGHLDVHVLDGGIAAWVAGGHPVTTEIVEHLPSIMEIGDGPTRSLSRHDIVGKLGALTLLDARAAERYRGETEPVDPVAGHIPTAVSAPLTGNLDAEGLFLPTAQLRERYESLGVGGDVAVYCGSGVTACHDILAMVHAGFDEPALYPGSWSDWSTAGMPVATGHDPGS